MFVFWKKLWLDNFVSGLTDLYPTAKKHVCERQKKTLLVSIYVVLKMDFSENY